MILILLRDKSLSSTSFSYFWIIFYDLIAFIVTEYFPYLFILQKSFVTSPCVEPEVS